MGRYNPTWNSATGGVVTGRLDARDDLDIYPRSLRAGENFMILPHGGVQHRPGSVFVAPVGTETSAAALIPFEFSTEQAYVVEAGPATMRFFTNQGQLVTGGLNPGEFRTIDRSALASVEDGTAGNSVTLPDYTPTAAGISGKRTLVVVVTSELIGAVGVDVQSVTHAGTPMTLAVAEAFDDGTDDNRAWIYFLHNPSANGPIVVTFTGTVTDAAVTAMTLRNIDDTVAPITDTAEGALNSLSVSVDTVVDNTFLVTGVNFQSRAGGGVITPTGLGHTELVDIGVDSDAYSHGVGELSVATASTVTPGFDTVPTQSRAVMVAAAFTPVQVQAGEVGDPVELASPYAETEVQDVQWAQLQDVMYLTQENHWPQKLIRTTPTTFTIADVEFQGGRCPFLRENLDDSVTLALSGTTLTAAGASAFFEAPRDVGRFVRRINSTTGAVNGAIMRITSVTSGTVAEVEQAPGESTALANFSADANWQLGAISDTVGFNSVIFHDGRLVYGGGIENDRIFASISDGFDDFDQGEFLGTDGADADRAFSRRCVSRGVNAVRWFASTSSDLFIGTTGTEFRLRPANDDILTPTSASVRPLSSRGSRNVQAVTIDNNIMFVQRGGQKVRNLAFSLSSDTFKARDVTVLSEQLLNRTKTSMRLAYQQTPDSVLWSVREDGALLGLTFEEEQEVLAWHPHFMGGTNARVESIAVIPTPDEVEDQLWMVVSRTIGGTTRRYVEYIDIQYRPDVDFRSTDAELRAALADAYHVDAGLRMDFGSSPQSVITGLDHLEGELVAVTVDGGVHPDRMVLDGQITLLAPYSKVAVGLYRKAFGWTQRMTGGGQIGTDQGQQHRIPEVGVRLHATLGLRIGAGEDADQHAEDIYFRDGDDLMNAPPPLFFGDVTINVPTAWDTSPSVYFESPDPLPATILALYPRAEVHEG